MSNVTPIAANRIEIGRVVGCGRDEWMMFVVDAADEDGDHYAKSFDTRDAAVAAAAEWRLPVRFLHDVGTITAETPWSTVA